MSYSQEIEANRDNPEQLEALFQAAQRKREADAFAAEMQACHSAEPENRLYAAWHFRLLNAPIEKKKGGVNWSLAIPLAGVNGVALWVLSHPVLTSANHTPYLVWLAAPVTALFIMAFLTLASGKNIGRALLLGLGLVITTAIGLLQEKSAGPVRGFYQVLLAPHLALLSWACIGACLVGFRSSAASRFASLVKSIEWFLTCGVYLIAGIAFGAITMGMFAALNITLPQPLVDLILYGGVGLFPVIATATTYDPLAGPLEQDFKQGLSRFVATLMRLLLPLTLGVLAIYLVVIPFNFLEPFKHRDVLIVYNIMLFAIIGLLAGATPLSLEDLPPRLQVLLRRGILVVGALAALVSLYALAALLYRTAGSGITINREVMLGWNIINILLLALLIVGQLSRREQAWNERIHELYSLGTYAYVGWSLLVVLVMPLIFR